MDRKLGIIAECIGSERSVDTLDAIKEQGFDTVFTGLINVREVAELKNKADKLGLPVEFIHAPFKGINEMWLPGDGYKNIYDGMLESIESASECDIPMIITHVSSGWKPPKVCDIGLARYDALVEYAIKKGVKVAFENLRKVGNFACLMDRYEDVPEVGFCYDVGHEHCYTVTVDMMDVCGDRTFCTHVHDNYGRDRRDFSVDPDLHLLPFDGTVNYQKMIDKLDEYEYTGSIMLEVFNHRQYSEWSKEKFLLEAYERAKKINAMSK